MQLNVGAQLKVVQQYSFQMDVVMLPSTEEDPSGGGRSGKPAANATSNVMCALGEPD
jgi:hypothetical protein